MNAIERASRLPAYGRQLKAALNAGLRPRTGGGTIIVTTDWNYARAFYPGRVVCPTDRPADEYDLAFLDGCEVIVLVHERDQIHGKALETCIRQAGARAVSLHLVRDSELREAARC